MKRPRIKQKIKKIMNRSGICKCDICGQKEILVIHHINGRDIPNYNHPSNRCSICSNCHQKCHEGLIVIEKWLMTSNGIRLFWHSENKESFSGENSSPYLIP